MKHILAAALLCIASVVSAQQTQWQRPVPCYDVATFLSVMKEMRMKLSFAYDTPYGVMGGVDNGINFLIYEYVKKENMICVYAEVEKV